MDRVSSSHGVSLLTAVAILILLSIPIPAGAQASSVVRWDLVGTVNSPESGRIEVYLLNGMVHGPPASREFLEKVVWTKHGKTITARNVVDCGSKVRKLVLLNEYKRHHVDGSDRYTLVRSQEPKDPAMKVDPDLLAEVIYNEVCLRPALNNEAEPVPGANITAVSQEASEAPSQNCAYWISPGSHLFSSSGASGTISVSTQTNCQWLASLNAPWVLMDSTNKGSGSDTISFSLSANPGADSRTAQITAEGQIASIAQEGNPESVEYTLTVRKTGKGRGAVTTNHTGNTFRKGTTVTLSALPGVDSVFSGWSGACSGTARNCTIKISSASSVTASFSLKTFTISVPTSSNGTIYPAGPVKATYGEELTFQMFPLSGYRVSNVLVDGASAGAVNSYRFKSISADHVIQATFVKE